MNDFVLPISVMLVICMLLSLVFPSSGGGVKCSLSF